MKTTTRLSLSFCISLLLLTIFSLPGLAGPVLQKGISHQPRFDRFYTSRNEIHDLFAGKGLSITLPGELQFSSGRTVVPFFGIALDGTVDTLSVLTAVTEERWSIDTNTWMNSFRTIFTHDAYANVTEVLFQVGFFSFWQDVQKANLTNDVNGRVLEEVGHTWNGGVWLKSYRILYSYGPNGLLSGFTLQTWNGSSWDNNRRDTYTYDGFDRPVHLLQETWNGSMWINSLEYTATYDGNGNLTNILERRWEPNIWIDVTNTDYTYDGSNREILQLDKYWDGSAWLNEVQYTSSYNTEGYLSEYVRQNWVSSAWLNVTRIAYLYDEHGNATDEYGDEWNGAEWIFDYLTMNIYDERDNIVESFSQSWTGSDWVNSEKVTYSWGDIITPETVTRSFDMLSKWNMVSVPLTVSSNDKEALFPTSVSNAFYFDAGYTASDSLDYGRGYWLKFDTAQSVMLTGEVRSLDTIAVAAGWNMVGSIGVPITVAGVGSIPGGLVVSNFFSFDGMYTAASTIEPGKGYWVKVAGAGQLIFDGSGMVPAAQRVKIELPDDHPPAPPVDPHPADVTPQVYALRQNYPNPFNPETEIRYSLGEAGHVRISVYNVIGEEVAVLIDGRRDAGAHTVTFDAAHLSSGVYFYRMTAGSFTVMRRMILLR